MPNPLNLEDVIEYVENNVGKYHARRLQRLDELKLKNLLVKKNPYLFKAKGLLTPESLVKNVLDAYLSSQEETIFGEFLEGIAVFVNSKVYGGVKPDTDYLEGIDLVFEDEGKVFVVEIKSGPKWANASQLKKMIINFDNAKEKLQSEYPNTEIVAINGCSYGVDTKPLKKALYWKLCGQDFWRFISNNDYLYTEIIEPFGHQAKQKNDEFTEAYAMIITRFAHQFYTEYCLPTGEVNWEKLVRLTSERRKNKMYPFENDI